METLSEHKNRIQCMLLMKNGLLITGSKDSKIKVWNLKKKMCIKNLDTRHVHGVSSLLELPGNVLASGCYGEEINFWDFERNYFNR